MNSDEMWEQGKIIHAEAYRQQEYEKQRRNGGNSSSNDGELLGTLIVIGCYAAYQGAKFAGKAAIAGGKMAVEGGKIAGKTVINARKLHKGEVEIVNTDNQENIIEKAPEYSPTLTGSQESPTFSKREKVKEWIGKGIKKSRSASELLTSAYKLTTSTTEEVVTDAGDKTKVIIKPNTVNTEDHKIRPLINKQNKYYGEIQEDTINTMLKYRFNGNKIVEVTKYKSFTIPSTILPGEKFELRFELNCPNGEKIRTDDTAYLQVNYDISGKLVKLAIPNQPVVCHNPSYPALIAYHNELYVLPVNSGHYNYLTYKVHENGGVVEIGNADPGYHIEAIS